MRVSNQDSNSAQTSLLSRLREQNLTPAEALHDESSQARLHTYSARELAELRQFRSQVLEDVQQVQNGTLFPSFPGFPGFPNQPDGSVKPPPIPVQPSQPDYSCHDPQEILRRQDPEAYAALASLPQETQTEFLNLVRAIGFQPPPSQASQQGLGSIAQAVGRVLAGATAAPQINPDLLALLKSGKLSTRDSTGKTLLQNLSSLATQEMGPNLDRATVFNELCKHLNDPGHINQGSRNTCVPTTIQHLQAVRDPAEYARIVAGLTSESGEVAMRNGDVLKRDLGSVGPDTSRRDSISRLYQAALMEYANGENEYDNRTDTNTRSDDSTYQGLYDHEAERAVDALFGDQYDRMSVDNRSESGRSQAEDAIRRALDNGGQVPVLINWTTMGHALLLTGMTDSTVILRNPWGQDDSGGSGTDGAPPREALDNRGTIEMSKEEFFSRLYSILLPKENGGSSPGFPGLPFPGIKNKGLDMFGPKDRPRG